MCEPGLTWNLVAMYAVAVGLVLVAADLLLRYLDNGGRGLIPYRAIFKPFFLLDEKTFQEVDKEYRRNQHP